MLFVVNGRIADTTGGHKIAHYVFSHEYDAYSITFPFSVSRPYMFARNHTPLYERGWMLQERVLSRSTIHLGRQVLWECMSSVAWEAFPLLSKSINYIKDEIRHYKEFLTPEDGELKSTKSEFDLQYEFSGMCMAVVSRFSHISLTEPRDRLVAIRGIMNRLRDKVPHPATSSYAGGLWDTGDSFALYLNWSRATNYQEEWASPKAHQLTGVLNQHFSSWSWAASFCDVAFTSCNDRKKFDSHRELIKLDFLQGSDNNVTDPLGPARIVLRGKPIPLINPAEILIGGQTDPVLFKTVKCALPAHTSPATGEICPSCEHGFAISLIITLDQPIRAQNKQEVERALLPLYDSNNKLYGLVLERVGTQNESPVYKHLGDFKEYEADDCLSNLLHLNPKGAGKLVKKIPEELYK